MNSERWQKVKALFDAVVELEPLEREKLLDKSCGDDNELRRDVEELLASSDEAESFMEHPAAKEVASLIIEHKNLAAGESFGHYEIVRQIGVGGMGEVYLAKDGKLDRLVAVKILNQKFAKHESNLQRFKAEAKATSALNHPNILVIHEIGVSENANYIVSEFIEGETLRDCFKHPFLKLSKVLDIAIQIANALVAAHTAKIIHRDIKPENIMIRPDGYVKILDFGLAKLIEQKNKSLIGFDEETANQNQTAKGIILGTINYMSPEQAKGEKVDARTDIFSFGTVIYEMVAGKTPFAGDSMSETFANLINAEPQPLSRFAANLPDELERIVSKTLNKNKDERYQTMKDLLADLKNLRENLAFDEKLGKSHSSNNQNTAIFLPSTTGNINNRTEETNNNFFKRIKQHKSFAALALVVLLLSAIGFSYYFFNPKKSASGANVKKSLAVLPFINSENDPNAEYLSDGITESVINNLSQISSLRVMSRNSAFRFKDNQTDIKNIASQLGVETIVTGDIKQLGDKLVINVRLIDASDNSQIWGNQYVKNSGDILAAQNEIAQAVANNLRVKLTNSDEQKLVKNYTENPEAWQLYLKGRYHALKITKPEIEIGIKYYQQAIELDPKYALAYVGLSDAYRVLTLAGEMPPTEFFPKAKAAAQKAVELDDTLAEAHANLGASLAWNDWDWNTAEAQYKRALELNPNYADAHLFYGTLHLFRKHLPEALAEVKRAREIDPLSLRINLLEGQFLNYAGKYDEALAVAQKLLELDPTFWVAYGTASGAYVGKKMYPEAIAEARKARQLYDVSSDPIATLGYALAKSGKQAEAREVLEELLKQAKVQYVSPYNIAIIYNALGETNEALSWLERGYQQKDTGMPYLKVSQDWNNLQNNIRFIELMKRMNFE